MDFIEGFCLVHMTTLGNAEYSSSVTQPTVPKSLDIDLKIYNCGRIWILLLESSGAFGQTNRQYLLTWAIFKEDCDRQFLLT